MSSDKERWAELITAFKSLSHVPKIQKKVRDEYEVTIMRRMASQATYNWALYNWALERALVKHAYYEVRTMPSVMTDGATEYEDILAGETIWDSTQKSSGN